MSELLNGWNASHAKRWVADAPGPHDHKYTRGVLGVRTGSPEFPGAAVLGVEAAWRTGLGMVRYLPFGSRTVDQPVDDPLCRLVLHRRPETVIAEGNTNAWLVGSGVRTEGIEAHDVRWFAERCGGSAPMVIDAGAIESLAGIERVTAPVIITPHVGEFTALARRLGIRSADDRDAVTGDSLLEVAQRLRVVVLLKGSVTRVVTPTGRAGEVGPATPWLATAGTGDVLAGILGALCARHHDALESGPELLLELGLSAALLHDVAARVASGDGSAPITALDVAEAIPAAIRAMAAGLPSPDPPHNPFD